MEFPVKKLAAALADIPDAPGVYVFKRHRVPLYVGKAKSLRKRLAQYAGGMPAGDPKTAAMLARAGTVEVILTVTEVEALLLEMTLIGRWDPKYNVTITGFPYIKVTAGAYPRIFVTREAHDETTGRYLGPFTDAAAVRRTVELTNRAFGLRTCTCDLAVKPPRRACLDYETGICAGPCVGAVSQVDYAGAVERALRFITGRRAAVFRELERRMAAAAAAQTYEEAAHWRDVVKGLRRAAAGQVAVVGKRLDADAVATARRGGSIYAVVLRVREGKVIDRVAVKAPAPAGDELEEFIIGHYGRGAEVPPRLFLNRAVEGEDALAASLTARRAGPVKIEKPKRGEGARLLAVAKKNLDYFIETAELSRARRGELGLTFGELATAVGLPKAPRRVEMIDVSNLGGQGIVGSLVAFRDGVPDKNCYRRYRIKTVRGQDDLASLAEITRRRFAAVKRGDENSPDLFVVDGGPNQLKAVAAAVGVTGVAGQAVAALAKDPDRLFVPGKPDAVAAGDAALLFLARVRDEAHRFAITYHRKVRGRAATKSILDDVAGVGPQRKKALLRHFASLEEIAAASTAELAAAPGMNRRVARRLYDYLHGARERR